MLRTCLCLLIAFASAGVAARDVKLSGANGGGCPDRAKHTAVRVVERDEAGPVAPSKAKPSVHSDVDGGGRMQSPRWHRFLPGMFR